jgi:2,3-bisphosphoglycerate-independent phosphoglycerate mutase
MGAGKVLNCDLVKISKSIFAGDFHKNPAFLNLFEHVKKNEKAVHVFGLVSDGGVHSHKDHLLEFVKLAKEQGVGKVFLHAFTDGRDTGPYEAKKFVNELSELITPWVKFEIVSMSGRFYGMDRDGNWDRLAEFDKFLFGSGNVSTQSFEEYIDSEYADGRTDEHLKPIKFSEEAVIQKGDGVFVFNFRADRARMITAKLLEHKEALGLHVVTMTDYDSTFSVDAVAFPKDTLDTTLANEISNAGLSQAHIAETEKYAHVTYFFNGGVEQVHDNEEFVLVESRKDVPTHDLAPNMRASEVTSKVVEKLLKGTDFVVVNYANADMVGHTGNVPAILTALDCLDEQLGVIVPLGLSRGYTILITADHGNAETNVDAKSGHKHTAHTNNLVPFVCISEKKLQVEQRVGGLQDIAPTVMKILGLVQPESMTGVSLV